MKKVKTIMCKDGYFYFCFVLFWHQKMVIMDYILLITILNNMYFIHITSDDLNINVIIDDKVMIKLVFGICAEVGILIA